MLKYTFSFLLVLISFSGMAQEVAKTDTVKPKTERYGIRFGADLFKLTRSFYDKDYRGLELVGDYRLTRKHYIAAEIGNEKKTVDDTQLNFTTNGTYIKAGFDYNAYENWLGMENMIYVGLRYGFSSFSQTLNSYEVYNPNQYFDEAPEIVSGEEFNGLTAQWMEVVAGVKAEVFNNVFVGFSLRVNRLFSNKKPNNFDNLYIPGFNRTYDGDFGVGFNYTVSYFLPLYKSTVKAKEKKEKKKK
ncbi:DUF6048 family protein [Flavobacterium sp.]|uniref:DUF6048 family protein n=1 Tax=Flavobacterium sp. TaxID=239 RepID=UPI00260D3BFC|nr:DUF6048 family protein [Flavobacterium sp.]